MIAMQTFRIEKGRRCAGLFVPAAAISDFDAIFRREPVVNSLENLMPATNR
jgi:hypothetical protein